MATFGTNDIPSSQITVRSGGTVAVSAAFSTTVGLVGGMDTANGTATEGEAVTVVSTADADTKFGENSELATAVGHAFGNGASRVVACPVSETETTETKAGTASGTLDNTPVADPNVRVHDVTAQDTVEATSVDVVVDYGSPPTAPSDANTINLNPATGEFEADESSDYDITYTYGDYTAAITAVADESPRFIGVLTEATSVANDLETELDSRAKDFEFMHGIVGGLPELDATSYTHNHDERRLSVVASARGYTDEANTEEARTIAAVAGRQAGNELGDSTTYEAISGFADLRSTYTNAELGNLVDEGVLPLKQGGGIKIVKDMTTSTDPKFERIYASEITDETTEISHQISENYIGEANTESNRFALGESHASSYAELENDNLLDAYSVSVTEGADDNTVDVDIGVDIVDVMDTIDVSIVVGDVVLNGGAA